MTEFLHDLKPLLLPLLLPPIPMLLLMLVGAGLLSSRRRRLGHLVLALGFVLAWLSFCEAGAALLQRGLLGPERALDAQQIEALRHEAPADTAILVLGGGSWPDSPEYGGPTLMPRTLERLRYGLWLGRRTGLPVAFSGGPGPGFTVGEAALAAAAAREEWQQPLRWTEASARDTRENAAYSLPLLQRDGVRRILLVTHVQHMPRALRAFRQAAEASGSPITVVPAPMGLRSPGPLTARDLLPAGDAIRKSRYVIYEALGLLVSQI